MLLMKDKESKDKFQEPTTEYDVKSFSSIEQLPTFGKVIEKSRQDARQAKGISHEEMTKKLKLKYPFLN